MNFTSGGLRRGRNIIPNPVNKNAPFLVKSARERSLGVRGVSIFNLLSESLKIMNTELVDMFKNHQDIFLLNIPDQPTVTGLGGGLLSITAFWNSCQCFMLRQDDFLTKVDSNTEKPNTVMYLKFIYKE